MIAIKFARGSCNAPPIHCSRAPSSPGIPPLHLRDMRTTLCDLPVGRVLDDSSDETSNDSRSTISSDSVRKSTASVPETLSETLEGSREPCKPCALPIGCDDKPPQLPFSLLFFAHLGWGPNLPPGLRSIFSDNKPYFAVPPSHFFWQQLTPCVY